MALVLVVIIIFVKFKLFIDFIIISVISFNDDKIDRYMVSLGQLVELIDRLCYVA